MTRRARMRAALDVVALAPASVPAEIVLDGVRYRVRLETVAADPAAIGSPRIDQAAMRRLDRAPGPGDDHPAQVLLQRARETPEISEP